MRVDPKYYRPAAIGALLVIVIVVIAMTSHGGPTANTACGPYRTDKVIQIGSQKINAEAATTKAEADKGLSGRPCILPNQAMLFSFDKPGRYYFWMKGMRFPLDIVWITSRHKVAAIEIDVKPSTYPDKFANKDIAAQYVLELQANRSKSLGMEIGTPVNFQ